MGRWSSIGGHQRASDGNVKIKGIVLLVYLILENFGAGNFGAGKIWRRKILAPAKLAPGICGFSDGLQFGDHSGGRTFQDKVVDELAF